MIRKDTSLGIDLYRDSKITQGRGRNSAAQAYKLGRFDPPSSLLDKWFSDSQRKVPFGNLINDGPGDLMPNVPPKN